MFASREEAGKLLGGKIKYLSSRKPLVLGITRGGVVVAAQVARILKAPLYPLVIKKIGALYNPEFALGAVGPEEVVVGDLSQIAKDQIKDKGKEIKERMKEYGVGNLGAKIKNKTVIIVDDGMATGWTIRAAVTYVKSKILPRRQASKNQKLKVMVAVPVGDIGIIREIGKLVDKLVVLEEANGLGAVGNFYEEFGQVSDARVKEILEKFDKFSQR